MPMTRDDYRAALAKLGMTQKEVSDLLAVDDRTGRRWALGETIPGYVEILVRLWLSDSAILEATRAIAGKRDAAAARAARKAKAGSR